MAEAKKEKSLTEKLMSTFRKLGRKSDVPAPAVPEFTEVGIEKSEYKPHQTSECVPVQQISTWSDYAATLSGERTETTQFAVNETLNSKISLYFGDITTLEIDAIVNSASPDLVSLGDVGLYIHTAAGPELSSKCADIASNGLCPIGQARLTKGYKLPAKYVIHAVGPRGERSVILGNCYRRCLDIAKDTHIRTIAFPCIATLHCGYDATKATPVAVSAVRQWLLERNNMKHIDRVIFCVITDRNRLLYEQNLFQYFPIDHPDTVPYGITQDPYALALYEKAIKEGKETDKVIRVNIVGNYGQGKTSLKRRLVGGDVDGIQSTNSIEINRYKFTYTSSGRVTSAYEPEDESHELIDRIVEVARCTKSDSSGVDYQDSVTESEIFDEVDGELFTCEADTNVDKEVTGKAVEMIDRHTDEVHTEEIISETKQLLEEPQQVNRTLSNEEFVSFSNELRNSDSQDGESKKIMDIWDFGGQFVYYATHTMFHSRQAIYLLVFDLSVKLSDIIRDEEFPGETGDKDMEYFIRFWMNSIHSFVGKEDGSLPPVILVGTHRDKLNGNEKLKCEAYFDQIRGLFEGTKIIYHIHQNDFAVNNTDPTDKVIEDLLDEILEKGGELSKTVEIPAKWLPLEKALKGKRNRKIITFEELMQIDAENDFPLSCEDQVKLFLRYHHTKGTLFYFEEEPICNYIVLDPQYLIDAFKYIITSERFCKKLPTIRDSWNKLITEGKLENVLIDTIWRADSEQNFIDNRNILLEFLKKHHIVSEAMQFDETSKEVTGLGWYIVPSLLKDHSSKTADLSEFITGRRQTEIRFVMVFENSSLLQTIYSRVLAALLGKWSIVHMPANPESIFLFENLGVFRVNIDHAGIIELRGSNIELWMTNLCPSVNVDSAVADKFRRYCEAVVAHEFRLLRSTTDTMKKPYKKAFRCNNESHGIQGSKLTENITTLNGSEFVPCPDFMKHEISTEKAISEWFMKDEIGKVDESKVMSEKELGRVAQAVGQNWQLLGMELGLTQVQIEHVTANNDTMVMKIFGMLKTWKCQHPATSNMNVLMQALKDTKSLTVDWDEIRNICEGSI